MHVRSHAGEIQGSLPAERHSPRPLATRLVGLAFCTLAAAGCGGSESRSARPRNVLLVTIDTLRADHLGCYGYDRDTSPAIDRLAEQSIVFERAYASSSWTLPSIASLMTSTHNSTHGCRFTRSALPEKLETLAEVLDAQGYRTGAIVNHVFLEERYGLDQGFDDYDQDLVQDDSGASHLAVTSPQVTEKATDWLSRRAAESTGEPWFLWVHYFDPHPRYVEHEGITERFARESAWGPSFSDIGLYDGEIVFTDRSVGELLDQLDALGFADDTVVVLLADHGEEFGEHGNNGHRLNLHRETVQVPWIARVPGLDPARVDAPVSTLDVLPTVLAIVGCDPPEGTQGENLLPALLDGRYDRDRPLLAELRDNKARWASLQRGRWKLILDLRSDRAQLFDVEADPSEQEDLADEEPALAAQWKAELQRELSAALARGEQVGAGVRVELDEQDQERIRDLGYAGEDE